MLYSVFLNTGRKFWWMPFGFVYTCIVETICGSKFWTTSSPWKLFCNYTLRLVLTHAPVQAILGLQVHLMSGLERLTVWDWESYTTPLRLQKHIHVWTVLSKCWLNFCRFLVTTNTVDIIIVPNEKHMYLLCGISKLQLWRIPIFMWYILIFEWVLQIQMKLLNVKGYLCSQLMIWACWLAPLCM